MASLRFGTSMMWGRPFSRRALERIVAAIEATMREFGVFGDGGQEALTGPALDAATRRVVQGRRLRTLARRAARETGHYRRLFRDLAIDPTAFSVEDLARIPPLSTAYFRDHPEDFVRTGARPVHRITTTGTTGWPATVWFTDDELYLFGTLSTVGVLTARVFGPDDVVQISVDPRNRLGVHGMAFPAAVIGAAVHVAGMPAPEQTLALLAERRRGGRHKPRVSIMSTHPSYLGELVETGQSSGYRPADFGLERILLGGEILTAGLRRKALALFGAGTQITQTYGNTELAPFGAAPCPAGHLHYEPALCAVEILDLTGTRPAAIGEPGLLVGTPLPPFRDATLLLRYDCGDVVSRLPDELDCPMRRLPAISPPLGKRELAIEHNHGWTFVRQVAEALEELDIVPMPARYGVRAAAGGVAVDVAVRSAGAAERRAAGTALEAAGVPVRQLRLVTDPAEVAEPVGLRCDNRAGRLAAPARRRLSTTPGGHR